MDPIRNAIETYHELNDAVIDDLFDEPSPLEFMRFVARNRPFVVRQAAANWDAVNKWNATYLCKVMEGQEINVAVTPVGNADAIVEQDGLLLFVEPHERSELFERFLDYVKVDSGSSLRGSKLRNVLYAQTQNDNLREEYKQLFSDVPKDIPFARIALQKEADAINMWIGNERSVTALHKDNYENIYVQVRGQKHFVLLSPTEMPCLNEQELPQARYTPSLGSYQHRRGSLIIERAENGEHIPFPTWDPDEPDKRPSQHSHLSKPLRLTLREGDMLYLPAMWYHKVSQTTGNEGFACAVNYWYDMDFSGSFWTTNNLLRDVSNASARVVKYPQLDMVELL